jgi:general stress protein CsbA
MAACAVTRNRWINIGLMTVLLLWMVSMISGYRLMAG